MMHAGVQDNKPSMTMTSVKQEIETALINALTPDSLVVTDDSAKHAGHAGASADGQSHFSVDIVSAVFTGQNRIQRHRLVNQALDTVMKTRIHALAIKARAPGE